MRPSYLTQCAVNIDVRPSYLSAPLIQTFVLHTSLLRYYRHASFISQCAVNIDMRPSYLSAPLIQTCVLYTPLSRKYRHMRPLIHDRIEEGPKPFVVQHCIVRRVGVSESSNQTYIHSASSSESSNQTYTVLQKL